MLYFRRDGGSRATNVALFPTAAISAAAGRVVDQHVIDNLCRIAERIEDAHAELAACNRTESGMPPVAVKMRSGSSSSDESQ